MSKGCKKEQVRQCLGFFVQLIFGPSCSTNQLYKTQTLHPITPLILFAIQYLIGLPRHVHYGVGNRRRKGLVSKDDLFHGFLYAVHGRRLLGVSGQVDMSEGCPRGLKSTFWSYDRLRANKAEKFRHLLPIYLGIERPVRLCPTCLSSFLPTNRIKFEREMETSPNLGKIWLALPIQIKSHWLILP